MTDQSITRANVHAAGTIFVVLPRALLDIFPEAVPEVAVRARTVADVMDALEARWPGVRDRLCDSTPRIRKHINVFVDGKRAGLDTALRDGIKIYILTAISGG